MSVFEKGMITVLACCAVLILAAIPLVLHKVPRNRIYGYRSRLTLSDDALWYRINAYFAWWLIVASLLSASVAVVLHLSQALTSGAYLNASILLLAAPAAIAWIFTVLFIRRLRRGPASSGRSRH